MQLVKRENTITVNAPAKLNLFLEVLGKRADGFHEIETLISAVSIYDTLSFSALSNSKMDFSCRWSIGTPKVLRSQIPTDGQNLVLKALSLLAEQTGVKTGAKVELIKRIPAAAGLGGASADAAAALVAANVGWELGLGRQELSHLAQQIGSDVPFFLDGSPAVCRGRGELISPFDGLGRRHFVIAKPMTGLSTAKVYQQCQVPEVKQSINKDCWQLFNRLEEPAAALSEDIRGLRSCFERAGATQHQMTGSGSAYFCVCDSGKQALRVAARVRNAGWQGVFTAHSHSGCRASWVFN